MDETKLGCRSMLVLLKLGFDMRPYYDDVLNAPLPPALQTLSDELAGYAAWTDAAGSGEPRDMPGRRD